MEIGNWKLGIPQHLHLVGVCGVGMAGLALLLKEKGHAVSGCDLEENDLSGWLRDNGISVSIGHDGSHVTAETDLVIRSRAVPDDCVDISSARDMGVPVVYRGEVLPRLLEGHLSVAVSGTHGKTTTSAFIAQVLLSAGKDPSWFVGAECSALPGVSHASTINHPAAAKAMAGRQPSRRCQGYGGQATIPFVVEADESDGTIALYEPDIAVITNVDFDHMEHFRDADEFRACFRSLIANTGKSLIYCGDDEGARLTIDDCRLPNGDLAVVSYGVGDNSSLRATDIRDDGDGQRFKIEYEGELIGDAWIPMRGHHNVLNALAAFAVCMRLGLEFDEIVEGLAELLLPSRRYELVVESGGVKVLSDYAHHPAEIRALIQMTEKSVDGRLLAVFQPHRYTRTLALGEDFPDAFQGVDELVLCPVYAASEKPIKGGTVYDLYEKCSAAAKAKADGRDMSVKLADGLEQAWGYIRKELREGDVLLVVGAGDVHQIALRASDEMVDGSWLPARHSLGGGGMVNIEVKYNESLAKKTTWGVGGNADIWAEVESEDGLIELFNWAKSEGLPFRIFGGGSNVLVSDLGVRGVVARLSGSGFKTINHPAAAKAMADRQPSTINHPTVITVGSGLSVAKLLGWLEEKELTGLEFLEGIPGVMGGVLRMNAGAGGVEICERVSWIRCLNSDGKECILEGKALKWEYRCCRAIRDMIVLEAGLSLDKGDKELIRQLRKERSDQRAWMKGLRSAGSIFKNPSQKDLTQGLGLSLQVSGAGGCTAGELIDDAGLKGRRVGGARVYEGHGNFIVTEKGASASDVKALIEIVKAEVLDQYGVELEEEIVSIG